MAGARYGFLFVLSVGGLACGIERSGLGEGTAMLDGSSSDAHVGPGRDAGHDGDSDAGPDVDAGYDAGGPPTDFYELDWERPTRVELGIDVPCGRLYDPIVTHDMRWLLASYHENGGCNARRFQIFEWNDGLPVHAGMVGPIHVDASEHNGHLLDGAVAGRPGDRLLLYTVSAGAFGDRDLMAVFLTGDPPAVAGSPTPLDALNTPLDDSGPTLPRTGDYIVFDHDSDLYEATRTGPLAFTPPTRLSVSSADAEIDAALSVDGRVLVFCRLEDDWNLWVARRREVVDPFESPVRLPLGPDEINTTDQEYDTSLAPNGDLLFTRRYDDGSQEMYRARAVLP